MKVTTIIGARPQFIKAAAVSRTLLNKGIEEQIIHTGQHYDPNMSDVFFQEMDIPKPNINLDIHDLGHGAMTGRMLEQIERHLLQHRPDAVVVYGDTNSTLAGALAAAKIHIPVAHVEAGLRSFDMGMPEEVNRILADRISNVLFCPTHAAVHNLQREGFEHFPVKILQVGDVMLDTLLYYQKTAKLRSKILEELALVENSFLLATIHRAENTNDPERLRHICDALNELNVRTRVILPLHPRTKSYLESQGLKLNVTVIPPLGYFDMLSLLSSCRMVLTDSGGLQKEAYFCGKFCVTLRDQTEWVELVDVGANSLVGASKDKIIAGVTKHMDTEVAFDDRLYGDGHASEKIAEALLTI